MAIFKNPNEPRQPKKGVYGWFFQYQNYTHCLYIGQAGLKVSHEERCTLLRGINQLARATFTSDKGQKLDTDFVVGCAIRYVEKVIAVECFWQHIADDPSREKELCRQRRPLIQGRYTCELHQDLKCKSQGCGWDITKKTEKTLEQKLEVRRQAEGAVFEALRQYISERLFQFNGIDVKQHMRQGKMKRIEFHDSTSDKRRTN